MTLGEQLKALSDGILDLIQKSPDIDKKKELREKLTTVLTLTAKLVDANVDAATAEYKAAVDGLNKTNQAIKEALSDLAKVADTITRIAKAVDLVGKVASMVP